MRRIKAVAFDVIETLFNLEPLQERLAAVGVPGEKLPVWFARMLRDAFALEVAGVYQSFEKVASGTLEVLMAEAGAEPSADLVKQVIEGFRELPAYPDVRPAFEYLHAAGVPVVTLTNGSEKATRSLLEEAGLDGLVRNTLSIDNVKHWKPAREVYLYAAESLGIEPGELALVAAHAWDIQGAHRAGLMTGWVIRKERLFLEVMDRPDVEGASVDEVVRRLVP